MSPALPPAWIVSALALLAALAIGMLNYMPRLIRLALVLPTIYFAGIYFYASLLPSGVIQLELVRFGLVGLFLTEIVTAAPYLYRLYRTWISERLKTLQQTWRSRKERG
jgi:hypothetical protein